MLGLEELLVEERGRLPPTIGVVKVESIVEDVEEDLPCFFFFPEFMEMVIFVFLRGAFLASLMAPLEEEEEEEEDGFVELLALLFFEGPSCDDFGLVS